MYTVVLRKSADYFGTSPLHAAVVTSGASWWAMTIEELVEEVVDRVFFVYVKKIGNKTDITWEEALQVFFEHVREDHGRTRFDGDLGPPPMPRMEITKPISPLKWLSLVRDMGLLPAAIQ